MRSGFVLMRSGFGLMDGFVERSGGDEEGLGVERTRESLMMMGDVEGFVGFVGFVVVVVIEEEEEEEEEEFDAVLNEAGGGIEGG